MTNQPKPSDPLIADLIARLDGLSADALLETMQTTADRLQVPPEERMVALSLMVNFVIELRHRAAEPAPAAPAAQ